MSAIRRRGKSKKGALVHMSIRIPAPVWEYFKQFNSPTVEIRRVLEEYAKKELDYPLGDVIGDSSIDSPMDSSMEEVLPEAARQILVGLSPAARQILVLTPERIRQLEAKALRKLKTLKRS